MTGFPQEPRGQESTKSLTWVTGERIVLSFNGKGEVQGRNRLKLSGGF